MTQTCTTCFDRDCPQTGADMPRCEHYVRLSDVDPQPVVETLSGITPEFSLACPFWHQCDEIVTRLRAVERAVCDIGRAVRGELP